MVHRPKIRLYSFQPRFVPAVTRGDKTHTIRSIRKYPAEPGDILQLYYALRSPKCRLLMRVPCVKVERILITPGGMVRIDGEYLADDEREQLARRDGFDSFASMIEFWRTPKNRLPFHGHIIHWRFEEREKWPRKRKSLRSPCKEA